MGGAGRMLGTGFSPGVLGMVLSGLVLVVLSCGRLWVYAATGHDAPFMEGAVNAVLAVFVTAVAAERVAAHFGG